MGTHPELYDHRVITAFFLGSEGALAEVKAATSTAISKDLERDRMFLALGSTVKGLRQVSVSSSGAHAGTMAAALDDTENRVSLKLQQRLPQALAASKAARLALLKGAGRAWAGHLSQRRAWGSALCLTITGREATTLGQVCERRSRAAMTTWCSLEKDVC